MSKPADADANDACAAGGTFVANRSGLRLDRLIADEVGCGRRAARRLVRAGRVRVDGALARGADAIGAGREIRIDPAPTHAAQFGASEPFAPRLLWRSDELLVLDKPAGMHTHAGRGGESVAAFLALAHPGQCAVGASPVEAGLVHRLDRATSGVVLAASTAEAYADLRAQFAAHRVSKHYLAVVAGRLGARVDIDQPLARRQTRVVAARRRDRTLEAQTTVDPLEVGRAWSLVQVAISTGVTHQVRAHLALAGHPVVGDLKYGGPPAPADTRDGQLLHAQRITLDDGRSFAAAAPADFVRALWRLRRDTGP